MNGIATLGGRFRAELKFWMIHCFVSAAPIFAFVLSFGAKRVMVADLVARMVITVLFALACTLIGLHFGGYAKSRKIFPRALRVILHLRALQVGLFFAIYLVGLLVKPVAGLATFLFVPDFICGLGAERIYDRLSENVTVKGSAILEAWHPFLSAFVFMGLFDLVWSVVFCLLNLPTMLVLSIRDGIKRQRRARGIR
ncbi:MAG: hypothetical protein RLZZ505_2615 [Verrucomicrobiota bacterium]|jgi:hypothetical protein